MDTSRRKFLAGPLNETHIVSCVAFVQPEMEANITRTINATGLAEVPRTDGMGKLVILIEAPSSASALEVMDAVRALEGVLAVHLAYQHAEKNPDLQEPHP